MDLPLVADRFSEGGLAARPHEEGRRRAPHQMLVEIKLTLDVIIGRAGEPSLYW